MLVVASERGFVKKKLKKKPGVGEEGGYVLIVASQRGFV